MTLTITPEQIIEATVGESIFAELSFLAWLQSHPGQSVSTVTWTSAETSLATKDAGTDAVFTSQQGTNAGVSSDAVRAKFTMVAAGLCTVYATATLTNPSETKIGIRQFNINAIPT
jgi:hypothetical protein